MQNDQSVTWGAVLLLVFAFVDPVLAQICVEPPAGLVSWWDADSVSGTTAFDIVGGNDGTMAGGVGIVPGWVGNGFRFDGVDDFMTVGQPLSVTEGTVDFWVNRQGLTAEFGLLSDVFIGSVDLAALPNRAPTLFVRSSGTLQWEFGDLILQDTGQPLPVGEWHHLAITWKQNPDNSHSVVVYLDGMDVGSGTAVGVTGFTDLLVGAYNFPNSIDQFANAIIDELEVYDRALSAAEIQAIFNAGSTGKCKIVNNFVAFEPIPSTYRFITDTTGCPSGFVGIFSFDARLTNISDRTLTNLQVAVAEITDGNLLLTEDGLLGEGERFGVPRTDGFTDAQLNQGELVDVPFAVCLQERRQFRLFVDVLGTVLTQVPMGILEKLESDSH